MCVCVFVRVVGIAQSSFDPPYTQHGLLAQPLTPAALIRHADCTALNQRTRTGGSVAGVGLHSRHARPSRRELIVRAPCARTIRLLKGAKTKNLNFVIILIGVHAAHARSACTRDTHDRPASGARTFFRNAHRQLMPGNREPWACGGLLLNDLSSLRVAVASRLTDLSPPRFCGGVALNTVALLPS